MTVAAIAYPAIDPIALRIGPLALHWYGIAYVAGFAAAFFVMRWLVHRWGIDLTDDDMLTIVLAATIGVLVGGRLGYVLLYGAGTYWQHPGQIFAIWDGGMSFHGGLAGILAAAGVVAVTMKIPWLTLCDLGSVGAPVGLFFGRIANFINGELWGRTTTVAWGIVFPGAGPLPRHPSQLYEAALEGVVLLAVMLFIATRRPNPSRGILFGWLLTLYAVFRTLIEFFRQPDVQIGSGGFLPGGLTMGQVLSVPVFVAGIAVIVWSSRCGLPEQGRDRERAA